MEDEGAKAEEGRRKKRIKREGEKEEVDGKKGEGTGKWGRRKEEEMEEEKRR